MGLEFVFPKLQITVAPEKRDNCYTDQEIFFNHSGNIGDILYSLFFATEFVQLNKD